MSHLTRRTFVGSIAGLGAATLPAFGQIASFALQYLQIPPQ